MALLALPAHPRSRFSPYAPGLLQLTLGLSFAARFDVAGIAIGPLVELGRLSRTLGAPDMATLLADGGGRRDEQGLALVAGAADALLSGLIDELSARLRGESEYPSLLGLLRGFLLFALLGGTLLLRIARALLAALVLAFGAYLVSTIGGAAAMAGAVHTHANGLLDALHADGLGGRRDPLVGLQGQAILCKQGTSALLLEGTAVELPGDWCRRLSRHGW